MNFYQLLDMTLIALISVTDNLRYSILLLITTLNGITTDKESSFFHFKEEK